MAKSDAVWGIDLGNSSLKAIRCRPGSEAGTIEADAFDFIEYPKILTQPGADAGELVAQALEQFLSRNDLRGDRVAVSVPGQNGLARFVKLPPVEAKKIPDIVRFEARQQIPFDLADVIWDYQRMRGGSEEEGFALETEIGLFAMRRDQVFRALEPFTKAGIEVDFVQLTPLALYNFLVFDQFNDLPPDDEYDSEDPPESVIVLSMGTDATDLVITNGYRVWQRSIPLGGNHFTRALTKDMKLTFAKAEHLKRNATKAEDPKAVFQAMRPVFNDMMTEIQRSIGYFTTLDRRAKISRMVAVGNGMKLPGLRRYLAQNLGFEVIRMDSFRGVKGAEVLGTPAFTENQLCFGVSYGLVLQALGQSSINTNLLPPEIVKARMIRAKKPWVVGTAAAVMLGCTVSFMGHTRALSSVAPEKWTQGQSAADGVISLASGYKSRASEAESEFSDVDKIGRSLTDNVEGRILWLEVLRAINHCLPVDKGEPPKEVYLRNQVFLTNVECQKVTDLATWFTAQGKWYEAPKDAAGATAAAGADTAVAAAGADTAAAATGAEATEGAVAGPSGEGWVFELNGYHYHSRAKVDEVGPNYLHGAQYVRESLMKNLLNVKPILPKVDGQGEEEVSMRNLGVSFPILVDPKAPYPVLVKKGEPVPLEPGTMPGAAGGGMMGGYGGGYDAMMESMEEDRGGMEEMEDQYRRGMGMGAYGPSVPGAAAGEVKEEEPALELQRFDFKVQFAWQQTKPSERHKKAIEAAAPVGNEGGAAEGVEATAAEAGTGAATATAAEPETTSETATETTAGNNE
jgi:type IV pilus assembly protein PilM